MFMIFNPIAALIHDTSKDRWHPVLMEEKPLPGPDGPDKPVRHKSKGHHTTGFATREEATDHVQNEWPRNEAIGTNFTDRTDVVFEWDGEGIPAITCFFDDQPQPAGS